MRSQMTSQREFVSKLTGVFGFPVTPFREDLSLDLEALAKNVDEMAAYPFCALVAAGGTGEMYSMSPAEIEEVIAASVKAARGRMPVVAGTGFNATIGADIARRAAEAGAECILALPPYYVSAPEDGLFSYYEAIGRATDLPMMVYSRDWAVFTPEMVAACRPGTYAGGLERWPGRYSQVPAHYGAQRRPAGLVRRFRRRLRAGLFRHRSASLHVQHF